MSPSCIEFIKIDCIILEVFGVYTHRIRFDAHIYVFGHQNHLGLGVFLLKIERRSDDQVIVSIHKDQLRGCVCYLAIHCYLDHSALICGYSFLQFAHFSEVVQISANLPGIPAFLVQTFLKLVYLFNHNDGDYYSVIFKREQCAGVVDQYIRIQHKNLLFHFVSVSISYLFLQRCGL